MALLPPLPPVAFDPLTGDVPGLPAVERRLSELPGCFADERAYRDALKHGDPVVYRVTSIEAAEGPGQMHYGVGVLYPGTVGDEYFMTKGHLHTRREAAEVYLGLSGSGLMVLENEATGVARTVALQQNGIVYVPGHTAHRTVNTGTTPLVYIGIYPSDAGHDYGFVRERNFSLVVVRRQGAIVVLPRSEYTLPSS